MNLLNWLWYVILLSLVVRYLISFYMLNNLKTRQAINLMEMSLIIQSIFIVVYMVVMDYLMKRDLQ